MGQSYNDFKYKLPSNLYMAQTNGTNAIGAEVLDSTLTSTQYASPAIDEIYGVNTFYRFNITSYINFLLTGSGVEDHGFFLLENKDVLHVNSVIKR